MHGVKAVHISTEPVKEVFRGKTVWEGEVEVFAIKGHPKAKRIYAWGYENPADPKKLEVTAVLEAPPVKDATTAVRVAIAGGGA